MKISRSTKTLSMALFVLFIGVTFAFAHGGYGAARGKGGPMTDKACDGPYKRDCDRNSTLTEEQKTQLAEARNKFRKATQEVRGQIELKRVALRNEMIKDEPDAGKAMDLQKELSALKADLGQQRLQHHLEVKKIAPDTFQGKGFGPRSGRGGGGCGYRR